MGSDVFEKGVVNSVVRDSLCGVLLGWTGENGKEQSES